MKYVPAKASIAALLLFAQIHKIKRFLKKNITTVGMKKSSAMEAMRNSCLQGQLSIDPLLSRRPSEHDECSLIEVGA